MGAESVGLLGIGIGEISHGSEPLQRVFTNGSESGGIHRQSKETALLQDTLLSTERDTLVRSQHSVTGLVVCAFKNALSI